MYKRTDKGERAKNFAPGPLPLCCFDGSCKIVERLGAEEEEEEEERRSTIGKGRRKCMLHC